MSTPFTLREAVATDAAFIFNSWLKSYRHSAATAAMQNDLYYSGQHKLIEGLVSTCKFVIACNPKDQSQIYGYSVGQMVDEVLCVHFVYTKEPYRKFGLGIALLTAQGAKDGVMFCYTHRTHAAQKLEKRFPMLYHPYLAFYGYSKAPK